MKLDRFPDIPSQLFGSLFAAVQSSGIFHDSKTFADAVPLHSPAKIMAEWDQYAIHDSNGLRTFIEANFALPGEWEEQGPDALPLRDHIARLWTYLTRFTEKSVGGGSALMLPRPFVVPGGRFRELYYWDSYFTMLGLVRSGRQDLVEDMIVNFGSLIDRYGHIPNGARSYYLSRSHPPVFYLAAALSEDRSDRGRQQRLDWMRREHAFWMDGEGNILAGGEHRRVVRLPDGSLLNRYWDDQSCPRDESWAEDMAVAQLAGDQNAGELWRNLRAAAESGWDFSSRWLGDSTSLASIRTTRLVPVDLNSLLYGLEHSIADECAALHDEQNAELFAARAARRAAAINFHLWNDVNGHYADYDLDTAKVSTQPTAAGFFPLFTAVSSVQQAQRSAVALSPLLQQWGLSTTLVDSGQQWDAPNGWAPLQWVACEGLRNYDQLDLADTIASRWNAVVEKQYGDTGQIFEKYDVVSGKAGHGGEYDVEIGFGWTNGVALALGAGQST